jgi:hypothetical protein
MTCPSTWAQVSTIQPLAVCRTTAGSVHHPAMLAPAGEVSTQAVSHCVLWYVATHMHCIVTCRQWHQRHPMKHPMGAQLPNRVISGTHILWGAILGQGPCCRQPALHTTLERTPPWDLPATSHRYAAANTTKPLLRSEILCCSYPDAVQVHTFITWVPLVHAPAGLLAVCYGL